MRSILSDRTVLARVVARRSLGGAQSGTCSNPLRALKTQVLAKMSQDKTNKEVAVALAGHAAPGAYCNNPVLGTSAHSQKPLRGRCSRKMRLLVSSSC